MRRKRLRGLNFLLVIFLVFNTHFTFAASKRVAVIQEAKGTVYIKKSGGEKKLKVIKGMNLSEGDTIITGADGTVTVVLDDDKRIKIDSNSVINISDLKGSEGNEKTTINQPKGVSVTKIDNKLTGNSSYNQKTPTAIMGVKGTIFSDEEKDGASTFTVAEGQTSVGSNAGGSSALLSPGQQVGITRDGVGELRDIDLSSVSPFTIAAYREYQSDLPPQLAADIEEYIRNNPELLPPVQATQENTQSRINYEASSQSGGGSEGSSGSNTTAKSSNNNLSALEVSEGRLSPVFEANITNYTVNVGSSTVSFKITPMASDDKALIKVNDIQTASSMVSQAIPLNTGRNVISIDVIAENGSIKTYTITVIKDGPPTVTFKSVSQRVSEAGGKIWVDLELSEVLAKDVIIPISINTDSTATQGTDYIMNLSSVKILAGETTAAIEITILNDSIADKKDETIVIEMGTLENVQIGAIQAHTVIIEDDEVYVVNVSSERNGYYGKDSIIHIQVQFNKPVNVTGDTIILELATGGAAFYYSGSGSDTLCFEYMVMPDDASDDLDYQGIDALKYENGEIRDNNGNSAILTLPEPGTKGSLSANSNILVETIAPEVVSVSPNGICSSATDDGIIKIVFNESLNDTLTGNIEISFNNEINTFREGDINFTNTNKENDTIEIISDDYIRASRTYSKIRVNGVYDLAGNEQTPYEDTSYYLAVVNEVTVEHSGLPEIHLDTFVYDGLVNGKPSFAEPQEGTVFMSAKIIWNNSRWELHYMDGGQDKLGATNSNPVLIAGPWTDESGNNATISAHIPGMC